MKKIAFSVVIVAFKIVKWLSLTKKSISTCYEIQSLITETNRVGYAVLWFRGIMSLEEVAIIGLF